MEHIEDNYTAQARGVWVWWRLSGSRAELDQFISTLSVNEASAYDYIEAQLEEDQRHGLHLQGICHFKKSQYPGRIKALFANWGSLKTKDDVARMLNYIRKELTRVQDKYVCLGELPATQGGSQSMKRDDMWKEMQEEVREMDEHEFMGYLLNRGFTKDTISFFVEQRKLVARFDKVTEMREKAAAIQWRPWQESLISKLTDAPHPRHIYVILDKKGNNGKTFFMKHWKILHTDNVVNLSNGKTADLMHVMNKKPEVNTVFVNLPRSVHGIVNYQAFEQVKDGEFTSTKYDGQEVTIDPTHTVIFTNEPLNWDAMSKDRWMIMTLSNNSFKWENYTQYKMMGGEEGVAGRDENRKRTLQEDPEIEPEPSKKPHLHPAATPDPPAYKPSVTLDRDRFCPTDCFMCDAKVKFHKRHVWTLACNEYDIEKCDCSFIEMIGNCDEF
jgi:hypothetical protein